MEIAILLFWSAHPLFIAVIAQKARGQTGLIWFIGVLALNVAYSLFADSVLTSDPRNFGDPERLRYGELGSVIFGYTASTIGSLVALFTLPKRKA